MVEQRVIRMLRCLHVLPHVSLGGTSVEDGVGGGSASGVGGDSAGDAGGDPAGSASMSSSTPPCGSVPGFCGGSLPFGVLTDGVPPRGGVLSCSISRLVMALMLSRSSATCGFLETSLVMT